MDATAWIWAIGFVVVSFTVISLVTHIIERLTKPMEDIKEKLDTIEMYVKDISEKAQDISENTLLSRPVPNSLVSDDEVRKWLP